MGNFSQTRASNGNLITIYDPFSTRAQGSGFVRSAYPGNVIPVGQMDAVALNVMKYYQQPNVVTNAVDNAPSPNMLRARFGIRNATENASNTGPLPNMAAISQRIWARSN